MCPTCAEQQQGSQRVKSADDLAPALADVMAAAEHDERLTAPALLVLKALHAAAVERGWYETTAARWWLADVTGLDDNAARRALARLDRIGYLRTITQREVRGYALRSWLGARQHGRPPMLVRLALSCPEGKPTKNPTKNPTIGKGSEGASLRSAPADLGGTERDSTPASANDAATWEAVSDAPA